MLKQKEATSKFNKESSLPLIYSIILNFADKKKSFSLTVPSNWTFNKLKKFILSEFSEEITTPKPMFLYKAITLNSDSKDKKLSVIFEENQINYLIVVNKKEKKEEENKNEESNKEDTSSFSSKTKSEILASNEFDLLEKGVFKEYNKVIESKRNNKKESPLQFFPLMNYAVSQRIEAINKKDPLFPLSSFEPGRLEYYPLRDYFNFNLILRLLLTFIIFNLNNHLYKFIFLCFLIGYYWYSIYILVDAYYEKKKDEIKLTEEELKIVKNALLEPIINMKIENTNNDLFTGIINNQNKEEEKKDNPLMDNNRINNINNNNQPNLDLGANPNRFVGQNLNMFLNPNIGNNNNREPVFTPEMEGIDHLLNQKKDDKATQQTVEVEKSKLQIIWKCIYLLFITLIPNWTDEFERDNPFPNERNNNNNENNVENNNNNNENNPPNNNGDNINLDNANIPNNSNQENINNEQIQENVREDIKEAPKEKEEQPKVEHLSEEMIREQRARIFAQKYSKDNIDYTPKDEVGKSSEEKKKED